MREQICVTVDSENELEGPDKVDVVMITTCDNMKDNIDPNNVNEVMHTSEDKIMNADDVEYRVDLSFHYHDLVQ